MCSKHVLKFFSAMAASGAFAAMASPFEPVIGTQGKNNPNMTIISAQMLPREIFNALPKDAAGNIIAGIASFNEQDAQRFANYNNILFNDTFLDRTTKASLSDISRTPLVKLEYEGFIPGGASRTGPWTDITRVFKRPDGYAVFLMEYNYASQGGSIKIVKELINTKVGKSPATLSVQRALDGRAITELTWQTDKKLFSIKTWGDVMAADPASAYGINWLMQIAEGLTDKPSV